VVSATVAITNERTSIVVSFLLKVFLSSTCVRGRARAVWLKNGKRSSRSVARRWAY
jgi:hypothetical protein